MARSVLQNGKPSRENPILSVPRQARRETFPIPCRFRKEESLASFEMAHWALTRQRLSLLLIAIVCALWFGKSPARAAKLGEKDFWDDSVVEEIRRSGFIEQLYKR